MSDIQDALSADAVEPKTVVKSDSAIPRWESTARDRIASGLKRMIKPIEALKSRDAVEADTRLLVTDVLCDLLGFDKYEDLTAEYQVKGEFADYGVRVDKQLVAFVEIKRVTQRLNATHLRQVENYALKNGVAWVILTNAQNWQVYRVDAVSGEQSETTLLFEVDLLDATVKPKEKVDALLAITREGFGRGVIDERWRAVTLSSPKTLRPILLSEAVITEVRRQLWRVTKARVDDQSVRSAVESMLK